MTPLPEIEKTIKYVQKILKCFEDDQDNGIYKANLVILEALQVYAAVLGEPSEEAIIAAWASQFKSVGATDEEAKALGKKRYEDQRCISIPAYKSMISEIIRQAKS